MATVERGLVGGRPTSASLSQLWAERDAIAALPVVDDELQVRRLDAEIAFRTRLAGRAAEVDRPAALVEVLGEPPVSLAGRQAWRSAAGAIESYRARWDVDAIEVPVQASAEQLAQLAEVETLIEGSLEGSETSVDAVAGLEID